MSISVQTRPLTSPPSKLIQIGASSGAVAGLTIAATGMVLDALLGVGFWALPNAIGGMALGAAAGASRDFGLVTLTGVVLHMALSAGFAVAMLLVARKITHELWLTSVSMGLALWVFNYYAVGSLSAGAAAVASLNPVWMGGLLHAIFGAVTAAVARSLGARLDRS